jgi:FkbM family methyltransferase
LPGYDVTITDKIVIHEIFVENVYQVEDGDVADSGVVIDIGGNVGAFSILCAAYGAKKVLAFEPDSFNFPILEENIKVNGFSNIIKPIKLGVSKEAGEFEFLNGQGASFITGVKNLPTPEAIKHVDDAPKETIRAISLASAFADNKVSDCDILKIDCEGSEYAIIEGAPTEILNKAKYITMEFHITDDVTFGKMIAKLTMTHNVHIIGQYNLGGQIYAKRY